MCPDDPKTCRRVQTAIKLFIRPDAPKIDRQIFGHCLPTPLPKDKPEIIDILLQFVLLLIEHLKPDNGNDNGNGHTNFPQLANQAADLARQHVDTVTLSATAQILARAIARTVQTLSAQPGVPLKDARTMIRQANHAMMGPDVNSWQTWNDTIRDLLDEYANAGRLETLSNYLDAWTQISKGLHTIQ